MKPLDPIDVESYSRKYRELLNSLQKASDLLLPDAYWQDKEQLNLVKQSLEKDLSTFDLVLNNCSVGVLFKESVNVNATVESNVNQSVLGILWHCQDLIAEILLLSADFDELLVNLTLSDPLIWNLNALVDTQKKFNQVAIDLEEAATSISYLIGRLDD